MRFVTDGDKRNRVGKRHLMLTGPGRLRFDSRFLLRWTVLDAWRVTAHPTSNTGPLFSTA